MILGAFAKLRIAAISRIMSVRLSIPAEQLGSHWTDFPKILCLNIFLKLVEKNEVSVNSDENTGYFT